MIAHHPHICLFQPEIPQNTGSVGRLAAGSGCRLHLVRPFGFATDDRNLRRAGLDYWPFLDLEIHDDLETVLNLFPGPGQVAFFSKKATKPYWQLPASCELLVFGRETSGLPAWVHERYEDHLYQIPMFHPGVRSQNLSNAVSVIVYDRIRRLYSGAEP
jgi:tRNA (cytidine/uridine-2'-O-)-methyltransferase